RPQLWPQNRSSGYRAVTFLRSLVRETFLPAPPSNGRDDFLHSKRRCGILAARFGCYDFYARIALHKLQDTFIMRWDRCSLVVLPLSALIVFPALSAPRSIGNPQPSSLMQERVAQTSSQLPPPNEIPPLVTNTPDQAKTEQYTLSHEKYKKAVAYSRADYTLY